MYKTVFSNAIEAFVLSFITIFKNHPDRPLREARYAILCDLSTENDDKRIALLIPVL